MLRSILCLNNISGAPTGRVSNPRRDHLLLYLLPTLLHLNWESLSTSLSTPPPLHMHTLPTHGSVAPHPFTLFREEATRTQYSQHNVRYSHSDVFKIPGELPSGKLLVKVSPLRHHFLPFLMSKPIILTPCSFGGSLPSLSSRSCFKYCLHFTHSSQYVAKLLFCI